MHERCPVCDLPLPGAGGCPNYWCGRDDRGFDVVWAIGEHRGALRRAIAGLKYRREWWWVEPLGAAVAGFLLDRAPCFDDIELIVAVPGTPGRDHTTRILTAAAGAAVGGLWAVDASGDVIAKRAATRPLSGAPTAQARRLRASVELRAALVVTDPAAVRGRRVLAVDDVFTDGSTMREVALALLVAGAGAVSGLVLARQPVRPHLGSD